LLEAPQRDVGADNVAVGDMWVEFVRDFFAVVERGIARLHRHQILATGRRYTLWGAPTEESTAEIVVGFADLVGFTALGQTLDLRQVDALLRTFEARAAGTATSAGSRLVKLIGDEAMFVAGTADDALGIARALVHDPDLPELRVGIAAGRVVTRGGDVFGVPVNLAARLVATAQPGEILVDGAAAEQASGAITLEHRGARELPGFEAPVDVFAVSSAEG
jgi:class 3 adenylate cyclase